jgi:putative membrane-bound dehydrogenase-like protein
VTRTSIAITLAILAFNADHTLHAQTKPSEALQQIEGVRGGRHWIDQPTAPPKSPEQSLSCLQIEPGFEVQVIAAEPLVQDPVAITFDDQGRMFVVEYGDYPIGPPEGEDPLSRIVMLEDTNGDGQMDRRHLFANKLNFAHSFMAYKGGLLVGAHSEILFLKDTDGDNLADIQEVLFDGFKPAHPQMQIGCPRWEIDNWISLTYGPGNVAAAGKPDQRSKLPGRDFRFDPLTMQFEADSGLGQYGNTIDRWGHRFFCTNRNPILTTLLPTSVLKRNPFAVIPSVQYGVGKSGGATRVYPLVEMKSNYLSHAGTHTAACGVTAYTGELGNTALHDSVFVCEPIGHLVTRSIVAAQGTRLQAERARPKADFLASTDTWFRPVSLSNGPDGALYLADMYRLWVEHPKFLPPEIATKIDWRAGDDKGRIYRIVPKGVSTQPFTPAATTEEQVALLDDPNGWRQFLGQRLVVEQQNTNAVPLIRQLLQTSNRPTARLHALWTLNGLKALTSDDVTRSLDDSDVHVRQAAVQLSAASEENGSMGLTLASRLTDSDNRVRLEMAVALGNSHQPEATEGLIQLALRDGQDPWFVRGLLTSVKQRSGLVLTGLVADTAFVAVGNSAKIDLLKHLASVTGARGNQEELEIVLRTVTADNPEGMWWRAAAISGLGTGLVRHRGELGTTSLTKLLANPPAALTDATSQLSDLLAAHQQTSLEVSRPIADRIAAVELLAYRPFAESSSVLNELLTSNQPAALQSAAIKTLAAKGTPASEIMIERWQEMRPAVRSQALAALLRHTASIEMTLAAMADGQMNASALSVDQRVLLLKSSNDSIRKTAEQLFGGAVSPNRRKVVEQYQLALTLAASATEGAKVFQRVCARCHRVDGKGHDAGPDITDVRNRSRAAILSEILDPNAKVEPQFTAYTIVTLDGRTFSGLMASDSAEAVVLKMAEGKQQTFGRSEIDKIRAIAISLMPEGIEKDVTVQNMADLLEFLKNRSPQTVAQ